MDTQRKKTKSVIYPDKVGVKYMKKGNYLKIEENSNSEIAATPITEEQYSTRNSTRKALKKNPVFIGELEQ